MGTYSVEAASERRARLDTAAGGSDQWALRRQAPLCDPAIQTMSLWSRFFGRRESAAPPPPESESKPSPRTFTITRTSRDGSSETRTVEASSNGGSFDDWVREMEAKSAADRASAPRAERVRAATIEESSLEIVDLRALPSTRIRIRGSFGSVTDAGRQKYGDGTYVLVREPKNREDSNGVAVYGKGRRVGYATAAKAAALAPILDSIRGDAYRVEGEPPDESSRMHVNLPQLAASRPDRPSVA